MHRWTSYRIRAFSLKKKKKIVLEFQLNPKHLISKMFSNNAYSFVFMRFSQITFRLAP